MHCPKCHSKEIRSKFWPDALKYPTAFLLALFFPGATARLPGVVAGAACVFLIPWLFHFSLSASTLTVSSGSSRGSLASSRGSLASSRGSLSSISFTDIYGLPQYEKADAECGQLLRFDLIPFESLGRDVPFTDPQSHSGFHKQRKSLDTPQSLASLSSRSSLSSLSPPSSPLDTPFLPASRDSPLAQMTDTFEVAGLGTLDRLRSQASTLGDEDLQGTATLQPHGIPVDGEGPRERGPQPMAPTSASKR